MSMPGVYFVASNSIDSNKVIDIERLLYSSVSNSPKVVDYADIKPYVGTPELSIWAKARGIHTIVTTELLQFLKAEIGEQTAIEIGAGRGIVGKELGIPQTDSHLIDSNPEVRVYYSLMNECVTPLPSHVLKFEANAAVDHFKPDVVVGCWITEFSNVPQPNTSGYGVDEARLFSKVKKYIVVGNQQTHGQKTLLKRKHRAYHFPWIVSRSIYPNEEMIYIWENA